MPEPRTPAGLPARYRLEGSIARGGMAAVYAARDTVLDRPVAVKVLAEHLGHDAVARQRFEREARAAAALSAHPSVVTIYDVGEHDGRAYIVMERRSGSVGDRLASGRAIPRAMALTWLRDTASALDAAHERGIVHRDVKPANLLLDAQDRCAVADFGIASLAHESQVTQTGQVLGTAAYISPEQATGAPATPASDRYALAVVAFELLTGARPFPGDSFAAQARAHVEERPPRATDLPAAAADVLQRAMAKDPGRRPRTAGDLVADLETSLGDGATETRVLPARGRTGAGPAEPGGSLPDDAVRPAGDTHDRVPGRRTLVALAVVALALLVAVGALALGVGGSDGSGGANDDDRADGGEATATATRTPRRRRTPTPTATETATAVPTATATATATATPAADGDPGALNDQGYAAIGRRDYAGAVAPLQQAVAACGDSTELDPCGYAVFNLGQALNRSGDPEAAIPLLERRLDGWDFARDVVGRELTDACRAAGQECGGAASDKDTATGPSGGAGG